LVALRPGMVAYDVDHAKAFKNPDGNGWVLVQPPGG
jgi:hypothetical protein